MLLRVRWISSDEIVVSPGSSVPTILDLITLMLTARSLGILFSETIPWMRIYWLVLAPSHNLRGLRNLKKVLMLRIKSKIVRSLPPSLAHRSNSSKGCERIPSLIFGSLTWLKKKAYTTSTRPVCCYITSRGDKKTWISTASFCPLSSFAPSRPFSRASSSW